MIDELERHQNYISFDSEMIYITTADQLDLNSFKTQFKEKTGEELTPNILSKLDLLKVNQEKELPTNALLLLSDDKLRKQYFPYAKIECARFKGTTPGMFIDQKTIDTNVAFQSEEAFNFLERHVSLGATDYIGVYRKDRWEYPMIALREVIRNAVIHRDYSLTGKDIKIAIFDDKIEVTSPGKLMPSVDYGDMESGQSDIRNKTLVPVFKRLGIIEQWGNGLKLISDELLQYPNIKMQWKDIGMAFRVTFNNTVFTQKPELQPVLQRELQNETLYSLTLYYLEVTPLNTRELSLKMNQKEISGQLRKVIRKLHNDNLIENSISGSPNHPAQKHQLTLMGKVFLQFLKEGKTNNS